MNMEKLSKWNHWNKDMQWLKRAILCGGLVNHNVGTLIKEMRREHEDLKFCLDEAAKDPHLMADKEWVSRISFEFEIATDLLDLLQRFEKTPHMTKIAKIL